MTLSRSRTMMGQILRILQTDMIGKIVRLMVGPFFGARRKTSSHLPTSPQTSCTSTSTLTEIRRGPAGDWSGQLSSEVSRDMNLILNLLDVNKNFVCSKHKAIWDMSCLLNLFNLNKDFFYAAKTFLQQTINQRIPAASLIHFVVFITYLTFLLGSSWCPLKEASESICLYIFGHV